MTAQFDNNVQAVGFDANKWMGTHFGIGINFASGTTYSEIFPVASVSNMQFFGFISDKADITAVVIDGIGDRKMSFALDNFTFGVPEPATLVLFGLGDLCFLRRRS